MVTNTISMISKGVPLTSASSQMTVKDPVMKNRTEWDQNHYL